MAEDLASLTPHAGPVSTVVIRKATLRRVAPFLLASLFLSGCYSWTAIKPTELPKLNGASTTINHGWGGSVRILTVADLEAPDGRLVRIKGESDARISVGSGAPLSFAHPIQAFATDQDLYVQSANYPPTRIPLAQVQREEVSQYELVQSVFAISALSLVGTLILMAAMR